MLNRRRRYAANPKSVTSCHGTAMRIVVAEPSYIPEFHTYENVVWNKDPYV